ncbi:hypothetical protein FRC09_013035 [Ceratobasidium sp. 395]|nr:hypothetical protein FRC09_013035 [Ceratobasidium sp. 395]
MGEEHPDYAGRGGSQSKAKEASAKKIANSGHCSYPMSFSSSGSSFNPSLAWSMGNAGRGRFHITFPLYLDWYHEQPRTQFRSLQHRKERGGLQHEFIVLEFEDGSICRVERMGDPNARFEAISAEGTIAFDIAQSFSHDKLSEACLDTLDVVVKITFPCMLDLMDVLRICRAMHEGEKTCKYTLQGFNCYFFALAVQTILTAQIRKWRTDLMHEAWLSLVKEGLSSLSTLYKEPSPNADHRPFIMRIYSLLEPESRWPVGELLSRLEQRLIGHKVMNEMNKALCAVLWHTRLGLAIDYVLCKRVKDAMTSILPNTTEEHTDQQPSVCSEKTECKTMLLDLLSRAVAEHETALQTSKTIQLQGHIRLYRGFKPSYSTQRIVTRRKMLDFRRIIQPRPPLQNVSILTALTSPQAQTLQADGLSYARTLLLWVFSMVLSIFYVAPSYGGQPRRCITVEDELDPILCQKSKGPLCTDLGTITQKLNVLANASDRLLWNEWPWAPIHEPLRQHMLDNVLGGRESLIQVSFQNNSAETMPVTKSQDHLIDRIWRHSEVIESLKLGQATYLRNELEEKLSQIWVLMRNDDVDDKDNPDDKDGPDDNDDPDDKDDVNDSVKIQLKPGPTLETGKGDPIASGSQEQEVRVERGYSLGFAGPARTGRGNTAFTRRSGSHKFREPTRTNGHAVLVNNWHRGVYHQLDIKYRYINHGTAHQPQWEAIPTIMGEEHPDYAGYGSSQATAKNESAQKIANSGHCPA